MTRLRRTLLTAGTAVTVAVAVAAAVMTAPGAASAAGATLIDRGGLQRQLDGIIAAGATGALAEVRDGHHTWRGASGVAELDSPRPAPANGRVRVGSVTKTFVATVVMQLVDEKRLGLDDPVESWLPGAVPAGDDITIRQLLGHTSGLANVTETLPLDPPSDFLRIRWRTWTASELVQRAMSLPPVSAPGTEAHYSNTDYILLGMVVQRVSGRPYAEEIERRIIRPLRLHATSLPGTYPFVRGPHPHGYLPIVEDGDFRLVDITAMNPSVMGAAGELISSTHDLNRFYAALLGGRLVSPASLHEMTTPVLGSRFGLGLERMDLDCGLTAWGHDGDALGYSTWSFTTPDGRRQATVSYTWGKTRPKTPAKAMLNDALCASHATAADA